MKLLIITPFKNEEASIARTMDSIVKQNLYPIKWLLIDDSSDDTSPELVQRYQRQYPFILYHRKEGGSSVRATGNNVVDVFNYGLALADKLGLNWDIVAKLDADLIIDEENYLEFLVNKFQYFPTLGIASGATYILTSNNEKVIESKHRWHTQGPNKFYRKECLAAIGGLKPFKGWDGIDDILAREKGFITEKFFEQKIRHLFPTQTREAEGGFRTGLLREAKGYRNMGYPFYMYVFKSLKLMRERGVYPGLLYLYYGISAQLSKPLVSRSESKAVKKFMIQRLRNKFSYTE